VPRSNTGTYALPVSWTVTNEGQSATAMGAHDYVYLSADVTWDAADTLLTSVYTAPPLAAGASYTKNQTITTSAVAAGTYYLIVRADASGYVAESNETNNTRVLGPITFLAGPDLVPTALTGPASVPRSNTGTYSLPVSWTVANEGQSPATVGASDYIYLSTDATWDGADTLLATVYTPTPLGIGASYTKNQTITTSAVAAGTYYLIVRADAAASVSESNETNNTRVLGPLAFLAGPDLIPTALTGPTTAVPRNANGTYTLAVSWTVENQGPSPTAVSTWNDRLYLSTDATWDGADSLILSVSRTTALAPASSYTENRPSVTTGVVTAGSYYLIVWTDAAGSVSEADETNNTRAYGPFTLSP